MKTLKSTLQEATKSLSVLPHSNPELEAAVLLCHLLEKPRSYLYAWPEKQLTAPQTAEYQALIQRRQRGEPIAHITGIREFWSLALKVSPATLIPRPETELLVERALAHLHEEPENLIADLGTGCGAIALALASECLNCTVHATDRSDEALAIARTNADALNITNVTFFQGSWLSALPADIRYDQIISNPPYIPDQDPHLSQGDLPHEPSHALAAGPDGLADIRIITAGAIRHLKPNGWLLIEHGQDQGQAVRKRFEIAGFSGITTHQDLAGHDRMTEGCQGR